MALVQPLSDRILPTGIVHQVAEEQFLEEFTPERSLYETHIKPHVMTLKKHFAESDELPGTLYPEEKLVLDGMLALVHGRGGKKVREGDITLLRELLIHFGEGQPASAFQARVTCVAVDYRRKKDYPRALSFYDRALAVGGQEDRILFNLARVRYDMGDIEETLSCLRKSLEQNPELREAQQFIDFLMEKGGNDAGSRESQA